jgi:hypothetical protein
MVPNSLVQQPQETSPARDGYNMMDFTNLPNSLPCGSLSVESIFAAGISGHQSFQNHPLQMAAEYALANHIIQYHDSSHGLAHHGTCVANDPSQLISRCTLPKFNTNGLTNADPFLPQLQTHECGFQIQNPNEFAHHIFQEHGPALMTHGNQYPFSGSTSYFHSHAAGPTPHQQHQGGGYGPRFSYGPDQNSKQFSPSMSPLTNLSMGPSLSATPASLPTPSPLESEHSLADSTSVSHTLDPVTDVKPQVMAQEDQFLCRWLVGGSDSSICGLRFDNDEQLQKHCKHEHLKLLKKIDGGFVCGWANCTRNTCFTQRSKVERHMQVHTGCE